VLGFDRVLRGGFWGDVFRKFGGYGTQSNKNDSLKDLRRSAPTLEEVSLLRQQAPSGCKEVGKREIEQPRFLFDWNNPIRRSKELERGTAPRLEQVVGRLGPARTRLERCVGENSWSWAAGEGRMAGKRPGSRGRQTSIGPEPWRSNKTRIPSACFRARWTRHNCVYFGH